MTLEEKRISFEKEKVIYESELLRFLGVDGFDVYNCSVPFDYKGKKYIYGRVERRNEWARSWVRLFENTGRDEWTLVSGSMIYQLEDPFIAAFENTLVLGGTHVRYKKGGIDTYYDYFYKGADINDLYYFTTGPDYMKDIRLVEMQDHKIGVFSRPRSEEIRRKYGSGAMIGFTVIDSLDGLTDAIVEKAPLISGLFGKDEWGGCNQAYCLESGMIGVIGHICYNTEKDGVETSVYMNMSFVLNPSALEVMDVKIIGTRPCYPEGPAKRPQLTDCAFTSGIVMREDGKADLYSGIGDCGEGRIIIDYPFGEFGKITGGKAASKNARRACEVGARL